MTDPRLVTELKKVSLDDYTPFVGPQIIGEIRELAEGLKGKTIQHINSAYVGGGVAEILESLVPLMGEVGLDARWYVLSTKTEFCEVTKRFHNVFHGVPLPVTREMLEIYLEGIHRNLDLIDYQANCVVLHDQQPLGLAEMRSKHQGRWIWYCHIDPVKVGKTLWDFLKLYASRCDAAIYHIPRYSKGLGQREFFVPPAIDPLSDKNRAVTDEERREVLEKLELNTDLPIILQVSRFDRLKNHIGVIEAFCHLYQKIPCQLVLAGGGASDDPEGEAVYQEVMMAAKDHSNIRVLLLPPSANLEINVLQRTSAVVVQNSIREGFGLTVSEALWKERPVVASPVGGITRQVLDGQTGLLANNSEELAERIRYLLIHPGIAQEIARRGREYVRGNFLLPVYLRSWMVILRNLLL